MNTVDQLFNSKIYPTFRVTSKFFTARKTGSRRRSYTVLSVPVPSISITWFAVGNSRARARCVADALPVGLRWWQHCCRKAFFGGMAAGIQPADKLQNGHLQIDHTRNGRALLFQQAIQDIGLHQGARIALENISPA